MEQPAEIIAVIRDLLIILAIVFGMIVLLLSYRKISGILNSIRQIVGKVEEVTCTISNSAVAFGLGKLAAVILGLNKKRGDGDG